MFYVFGGWVSGACRRENTPPCLAFQAREGGVAGIGIGSDDIGEVMVLVLVLAVLLVWVLAVEVWVLAVEVWVLALVVLVLVLAVVLALVVVLVLVVVLALVVMLVGVVVLVGNRGNGPSWCQNCGEGEWRRSSPLCL
jgi:hypothetical protein